MKGSQVYSYIYYLTRLCPKSVFSVSARLEFMGVIDDPLLENLGVIVKYN